MHGKEIRDEHTPPSSQQAKSVSLLGEIAGIPTRGRLDADLAMASHVTLLSSGGQATAHTRDIATLLGDLVADDHPIWGGGSVTSSAYDTAWIAMVHHPLYRKRLAFPSALRWLLTHQAENGSWGSLFPYTLLPTLATLLALRRAPHQTVQVARAIEHAQRYLAGALKQWDVARHESVGFEVLAPMLLERLAVTGLAWSFPGQDELHALTTRKQPLLSMLLAGQPSTLVHSLEAFVAPVGPNMGVLQRLQSLNGGYGASPAATAAVLDACHWEPRAARWLRWVLRTRPQDDGGAVPGFYPLDAFEAAWVVNLLAETGIPLATIAPDAAKQLRQRFSAALRPDGATISRSGGLPPDGDDTAMVILALRHLGADPPLTPLLAFAREDHIACYPFERDHSLSTNAHALLALYNHHNAWQAASRCLLALQAPDGHFTDKWHMSPFYATFRAIRALMIQHDEKSRFAARHAAQWILRSQRPDGGWGCLDASTVEETAYAVLALSSTREPEMVAIPILLGGQYLTQRTATPFALPWHQPRLWRDKELYALPRVIQAAVLAAIQVAMASQQEATQEDVFHME